MDRTNNFAADAVVAPRMAEEGSESEKPSRWHATPHEIQPVVRVVVEPVRGQTLLLPPQTWSRGYLVLTDLLQLVFEVKFCSNASVESRVLPRCAGGVASPTRFSRLLPSGAHDGA